MPNIWNVLNGKKTALGMILVLLSYALGFSVPEDQLAEVFREIESIVHSFGIVMGIIGVWHKLYKAARS